MRTHSRKHLITRHGRLQDLHYQDYNKLRSIRAGPYPDEMRWGIFTVEFRGVNGSFTHVLFVKSTMSSSGLASPGVSIASAAVIQSPRPIAQLTPSSLPLSTNELLEQWRLNASLLAASPASTPDSEWESATNSTFNVSIGIRYNCDSFSYGRDLNTPSCLSALSFIPVMSVEQSFGNRDLPERQYDVGLPRRWLSCR